LSRFLSNCAYLVGCQVHQHSRHFIIKEQGTINNIAQQLNKLTFDSPVLSIELTDKWRQNFFLEHLTGEFLGHGLEVLNNANRKLIALDEGEDNGQYFLIDNLL
jgi:hypothetical protein